MAILIFPVGARVSIYRGTETSRHPEPIHELYVNYVNGPGLALAIIFEGAAARVRGAIAARAALLLAHGTCALLIGAATGPPVAVRVDALPTRATASSARTKASACRSVPAMFCLL